jgi:hypothetical protein
MTTHKKKVSRSLSQFSLKLSDSLVTRIRCLKLNSADGVAQSLALTRLKEHFRKLFIDSVINPKKTRINVHNTVAVRLTIDIRVQNADGRMRPAASCLLLPPAIARFYANQRESGSAPQNLYEEELYTTSTVSYRRGSSFWEYAKRRTQCGERLDCCTFPNAIGDGIRHLTY